MKSISRIAAAFAALLSPVTAHAYSALYVFLRRQPVRRRQPAAGHNRRGRAGPAATGAALCQRAISNGPTWVQDLSLSLGLGAERPSLAGGNDYAIGGATTGYAATKNPAVGRALQDQVTAFNARPARFRSVIRPLLGLDRRQRPVCHPQQQPETRGTP